MTEQSGKLVTAETLDNPAQSQMANEISGAQRMAMRRENINLAAGAPEDAVGANCAGVQRVALKGWTELGKNDPGSGELVRRV